LFKILLYSIINILKEDWKEKDIKSKKN
jgi:hypothetical protein